MGSFSEDGFVVTETATGISFTRNGGSAINVTIPNYASKGINFSAATTFHKYVTFQALGTTSEFSAETVWENLRQNAAPTFGNGVFGQDIVGTGDTSFAFPVGEVIHTVSESNFTIVNETVEDLHFLDPGFAIRYLYEENGVYYIATIGFGNGALPQKNMAGADSLWGNNVEGIRQEMLDEAAGKGAPRDNRTNAGGADNDGDTTGSWAEDVHDNLWETSKGFSSPLVLDLDGDGIELTSLNSADSVYWDLNSDGFAEATGWVDSDDGLLAIDLNADGKINNSTELFGDGSGAANGFLQLAGYDSNADGVITSEDAVFSDLRVWTDDNLDGVSEATELHTLSSLNITSISLSYSDVNTTNAGNAIKQESSFIIGGNTRDIVDAYFAYSKYNTLYDGSLELDPEAVFLPNVRGYGILPDLVYATSNDKVGAGNIFDLVDGLQAETFSSLFDSTSDLPDLVRAIMFRWAGVDGVASNSRGHFVDAQELGFLEKLFGEPFAQRGIYSNPQGYEAGYTITEAFTEAFNNIYARLVAQSGGRELFEGNWYYSIATDKFVGITGLSQSALDSLETEASGLANTGAREIFWSNVLRVIEYSVGVDTLSGPEQSSLNTAIEDSDGALDMNALLAGLEFVRPDGVTEAGTSSADTINGTSADDKLDGSYGNDTLNGGTGNDRLRGEADNDTLYGGAGGDYVLGGSGTDTYIYNLGDGDDTLTEAGVGTGNTSDKILFGSGIDLGDLTFSRVGNKDLVIDIDTGSQTGRIVIEDQFNYASGGGSIETLDFNGSSTYSLTTLAWTMYGTDGDDTLTGVSSGGLDTDTIYGQGGNDEIYSDAGADIVHGGDGDDLIKGDYGADTLYGDDGDDVIWGEGDNDTIYGGAGNDRMIGGSGNDTYYFVSGKDSIEESSGTDVINLDAAWNGVTPQYFKISQDLRIYFNDNNYINIKGYFNSGGAVETMVYANATSVTLSGVSYINQGDDTNNTIGGTTGNDILYGFGGDDTLNGAGGSNGNDALYGGTGNDELNGGYGDDYLDGGAGDDVLKGGSDNDTYYYTSGHDWILENAGTADVLSLAEGWTAEDVVFRRYSASLPDLVIELGGPGINTITIEDFFVNTNRGVETLQFSDLSTIALTGKGYETHGTSGNDTISGITFTASLNDTIYGYGGVDTISGGDGDDVVYGGDGNDTLNGNDGNDVIYGEDGDDTLNGYNNDDIMYGGDGNDHLDGASGNDILNGGAGNDILEGKGGNDTYVYTAGLDEVYDNSSSTDTLWMSNGITIDQLTFVNTGTNDTTIVLSSGVDEVMVDQLRGSSSVRVENITFDDGFTTTLPDYASWTTGTTGGDAITGTASTNTIRGLAGNDTIDGSGGNDAVHGGAGDDTVKGGAGTDLVHGGVGDDLIYGNDGLDTLYGGDGSDTFVFEAANAYNNIDVMKDFDLAENDKLDLSDLLSSYNPLTHAIADFVQMTDNSGNTSVSVDRDGTGSTYGFVQIATIQGVTGLTDEAALQTSGNLIT